jgi:tetratricopeptide (TPR) repeat protein
MRRTAAALLAISALGLFGCSSSHSEAAANLQQQQQQQAADQKATMSLGKTPITADTRFAAGQLAEAEGNYSAAVDQYQQAVKLNPRHQLALYRLGVVYTQFKQWDQAIDAWQRYVAATNQAAGAFGNLGFCYELSGKAALAESTYQAGIKKDYLNLLCRTNYGLMLARQGRTQDAVAIWQPVLTDAQIHYNFASVYQLEGRRTQARAEYQRALELDPNLTDAQQRLASLE